MIKRYVFWRTPHGTPYRKSDGKHAPDQVLAEIGKAVTVDQEGQVSWQGLWLLKYETAIRAIAMIVGPDGRELNEIDTWRIVRSAMMEVIRRQGGGKPVRSIDLIREADSIAADHFRSPLTDYALVSSLSIKSFPRKSIRVRGLQISPLKAGGRRYRPPERIRFDPRFQCDTGYQRVRVKTSGRTIHEAVANAMEALSLLRGLWNLLATYGSWTISMGSKKQKSIGVIQTGPLHTLHRLDGTSVDDIYWYEPDFVEPRKLFEPNMGWTSIEKNRRLAMRRISRLPFKDDLEHLIIRYTAALDSTNLSVAFLQMWSILEKLTDTTMHYDDTIQRAVWWFKDHHLAKELLESVRCCRNEYVHRARTKDDQDQIAFLVKAFVEPHLVHLIRNEFRVASLAEYGQCLALSRDITQLEKRHRQLGRALRFLKNWKTRNAK